MADNLLIYAGCEEEKGIEIYRWFDFDYEEILRGPRIIIDTIPSTWYV